MRQIWHLAVWEMRERRLVVGVAIVLGVAAPFAAQLTSYEVLIVTLVLAIGLAHAVALLVGATTVNRPLREGRLGFFYSRPIGEGSVWWGKLFGALLLALLVQMIVFLPGYAWAWLLGHDLADALLIHGASMVGLLGSVLVGHVLGAMIWSRSKFSFLDLAALLVSVVLVLVSLAQLHQAFAETAQVWLLAAIALAGLGGAIAGGWRQVRLGRVDAARCHRVLSVTVWGAMLGAAVFGMGFSRWVLDVDPSSMAVMSINTSAESPWFVANQVRYREGSHPRQGVRAQVLANAENGEWYLLPGGGAGRLPARLSRDGRRVIWTCAVPQSASWLESWRSEAWIAERGDRGVTDRRRLPVNDLEELALWEISPEGDRVMDVAYREDPSRPQDLNVRLRVWDASTGRPSLEEWVSLPLYRSNWRPLARLFWDAGGSIRLFLDDTRNLRLWRIDPDRGVVKEVASLPTNQGGEVRSWREGSGWHATSAMVRFGVAGQQVLVGVRGKGERSFQRDELGLKTASENGPAQPDSEVTARTKDGWQTVVSEASIRFTLYDGALQQEIWALEPVLGINSSVELFDGRALLTTFVLGQGLVFRVGGADGWSQYYPGVWGESLGWVKEGRSLAVKKLGIYSELDLDTGRIDPLPDPLRQLLTRWAGPLGWLFWRDQEFSGGELRHPALRDLLALLDDRSQRPTVVRVDLATGHVEPFFVER